MEEIRRLRMESPTWGSGRSIRSSLRFCQPRGLGRPAVVIIGRLTAGAGGLRKRPRPPNPRKPEDFPTAAAPSRRMGEIPLC